MNIFDTPKNYSQEDPYHRFLGNIDRNASLAWANTLPQGMVNEMLGSSEAITLDSLNSLGQKYGINMSGVGTNLVDDLNLARAKTNGFFNIPDASQNATKVVDATQQALDGTKKTDWGGILSGAGDVMAGIGALGSVGLGIWQGIENQKRMKEQLDLARENFNFQKGLANRNIANSARQINEQVAARAGLADAYGARNGSDADRYNKAHRVDGSPIG